jgi:hypothetical protein
VALGGKEDFLLRVGEFATIGLLSCNAKRLAKSALDAMW